MTTQPANFCSTRISPPAKKPTISMSSMNAAAKDAKRSRYRNGFAATSIAGVAEGRSGRCLHNADRSLWNFGRVCMRGIAARVEAAKLRAVAASCACLIGPAIAKSGAGIEASANWLRRPISQSG